MSEVSIRIITTVTILLVYISLAGIIGFFTPVKTGELWGLGYALLSILVLVFFAERLVLALVRAKPLARLEKSLKDKLFNELCLQEARNIKIYSSYGLKRNVYCLESFFGTPAIIISQDLLEGESYQFLQDSLQRCVHLIRHGRLGLTNLTSYLVFIMFLPRYFFKKLGLEFLSITFTYAFHPIILLNRSLVNQSYESVESPHLMQWRDSSEPEKLSIYDKMVRELASNFSLYRPQVDNLYSVLYSVMKTKLNRQQ